MDLTESALEQVVAELAGQNISFCPDRVMFRVVDMVRMRRMMATHGVKVRRTRGARNRRLALKARGSRAMFPGYHFRSYGPS